MFPNIVFGDPTVDSAKKVLIGDKVDVSGRQSWRTCIESIGNPRVSVQSRKIPKVGVRKQVRDLQTSSLEEKKIR